MCEICHIGRSHLKHFCFNSADVLREHRAKMEDVIIVYYLGCTTQLCSTYTVRILTLHEEKKKSCSTEEKWIPRQLWDRSWGDKCIVWTYCAINLVTVRGLVSVESFFPPFTKSLLDEMMQSWDENTWEGMSSLVQRKYKTDWLSNVNTAG